MTLQKAWSALRIGLPAGALLFFRIGDYYETFFEDADRFSALAGVRLVRLNGYRLAGVPAAEFEATLAKIEGTPVFLTEDRKTVVRKK